jgi:hypothetical protein
LRCVLRADGEAVKDRKMLVAALIMSALVWTLVMFLAGMQLGAALVTFGGR